jgi:hypothetical protein
MEKETHCNLLAGMFPVCQSCKQGVMVPLSDFGAFGPKETQVAIGVTYKSWVCNNPKCHYSIRSQRGQILVGKKVEPI